MKYIYIITIFLGFYLIEAFLWRKRSIPGLFLAIDSWMRSSWIGTHEKIAGFRIPAALQDLGHFSKMILLGVVIWTQSSGIIDFLVKCFFYNLFWYIAFDLPVKKRNTN